MTVQSWAGVDEQRLDDVCRRYRIATLFVFGSAARGEVLPTSDVDLLYELRPGAHLGWEVEDLTEDLADIFGRPVDLVSRTALHPQLRDAVLDEMKPVYAGVTCCSCAR